MKKNILLIDDDLGINEVIKIILEDEGYSVKTMSESRGVLNKIKNDKPDLILLDIWMPVISGLQVCRLLKSHKETAGIPVIMISASVGTEKKSKEAGADGFVLKPFEMDDLLSKVASFLEKVN
jgi:DNA-binding response OmpR family regulator